MNEILRQECERIYKAHNGEENLEQYIARELFALLKRVDSSRDDLIYVASKLSAKQFCREKSSDKKSKRSLLGVQAIDSLEDETIYAVSFQNSRMTSLVHKYYTLEDDELRETTFNVPEMYIDKQRREKENMEREIRQAIEDGSYIIFPDLIPSSNETLEEYFLRRNEKDYPGSTFYCFGFEDKLIGLQAQQAIKEKYKGQILRMQKCFRLNRNVSNLLNSLPTDLNSLLVYSRVNGRDTVDLLSGNQIEGYKELEGAESGEPKARILKTTKYINYTIKEKDLTLKGNILRYKRSTLCYC